MNQGKIWTVVHPTVGIPLMLGTIVVTSLIVHAAVLTKTSWYGALYEGNAKPKVAMNDSTSNVAALTTQATPGFTVSVAPVAPGAGTSATAFVVTVTPNPTTTADASTHTSKVLALASEK